MTAVRRRPLRKHTRRAYTAAMTTYAFAPPPCPSLAVAGTSTRLPVHRIYCIGRNYAEHAREMGATAERGQPMFFMKPADALVPDAGPGVEVRSSSWTKSR